MNSCEPTFEGYVDTTKDALILFQLVIKGQLRAVDRRPHDKERRELIRSGNVFIFNENTSGIKRWTDGVTWSPSRILQNFLVYRQMDKTFPPDDKKRAAKRGRKKRSLGTISYSRTPSISDTTTGELDYTSHYMQPQSFEEMKLENDEAAGGSNGPGSAAAVSSLTSMRGLDQGVGGGGGGGPSSSSSGPVQRAMILSNSDELGANDRKYVGSLVDSYGFKQDGLVKKTMSIHFNKEQFHLISYYKVEDVRDGRSKFRKPSEYPEYRDLILNEQLTHSQSFRHTLEHSEGGPSPSEQQLTQASAPSYSRVGARRQSMSRIGQATMLQMMGNYVTTNDNQQQQQQQQQHAVFDNYGNDINAVPPPADNSEYFAPYFRASISGPPPQQPPPQPAQQFVSTFRPFSQVTAMMAVPPVPQQMPPGYGTHEYYSTYPAAGGYYQQHIQPGAVNVPGGGSRQNSSPSVHGMQAGYYPSQYSTDSFHGGSSSADPRRLPDPATTGPPAPASSAPSTGNVVSLNGQPAAAAATASTNSSGPPGSSSSGSYTYPPYVP